MLLPWILCAILFVILIIICVKIGFLQKSMDEICAGLEECLSSDTNILISISSRDKHARRLAVELNKQLRLLRKQRWQYLNGDRELKEAVTNISHDLRTPLTAICGYLDLLEREEDTEGVIKYLSLIKNRTEALKQLTEELFRYSVIISTQEDLKLETVNVNAALEESLAAFYSALSERGITPTIQIAETQITRRLNRAALSRVLSNILNNALKYSDGDLDIALLDSGKIIFTNTASGLNEVQIGKLFDRFFSVEAARASTGLGLAISKTLIERMGGSITAGYNDGKLRIYITFSDAVSSDLTEL